MPEAGTPWVLMAFLGGRLARRPLCAAPAGAGLILVGLCAYVALVHFAYATSLYNITTDGRASSWGTLAVLFGSASGVVGFWTWGEPERLRQAAWGFAIGVPVAEAAHVLLTPDHPSAVGLALALVLTGAALVLVASRKVSWGGLLVAAAGWAAVGYTASLVVY